MASYNPCGATTRKSEDERMEKNMQRNFLEGKGLNKELIDEILDENSKDIGKAKGDLDNIKKQLDQAKQDLADRDKQLNDLKSKTGDNDELKKQIEKLQADNKAAKEAHDAEIKALKISAAVDAALSASKAKNNTAVKALLADLDKAELLEDGTVKGLSDQIKKLKESEDTKFLFAEDKPAGFKGMKPGEAKDGLPGNSGSGTVSLRDAIANAIGGNK